eukprot:gene49241-3261_t
MGCVSGSDAGSLLGLPRGAAPIADGDAVLLIQPLCGKWRVSGTSRHHAGGWWANPKGRDGRSLDTDAMFRKVHISPVSLDTGGAPQRKWVLQA